MPLGKAGVRIQFAGGVDLRTDPKQVAPAQLIDLENAVFTRQTTLSKRNGYRALSTAIQGGAGNYTGAVGLAVRDEERLLFTGRRCYSYRPSSDSWADVGEVAASVASTPPIARTGTYQTQPDVAERNGVRVVAWEDSRGGVWCSVIESATGAILLSQVQLDASALARDTRCVACGEVIHVLWSRADLGQIKIAVVNPALPNVPPVVSTLIDDLDPVNPYYDAVSAPNGDSGAFAVRPALMAWAQIGGGWRIGWIAPPGVMGSALYGLAPVATYSDVLTGPIAVAWNGSNNLAGVTWCAGGTTTGTVAMRIVFGNSLTTTFRTAAALGANTATFTRIACEFGATAADGYRALYWAAEAVATRSDLSTIDAGSVLVTSAANDAISTRLRGHGLVSRAFYDGPELDTSLTVTGDVYVMVAHTVQFFPYVATLRISATAGIASPQVTVVGRLMPGEASGSLMRPTGPGTRAWTRHLPSVISVNLGASNLLSRQHAVCVPYRIQLSSQNGDQFSEQGLKLATLDFAASYQTAQLGRGLYLASSAPMHYDGEQWREADFHCAPDIGYDVNGLPVGLAPSFTATSGGSMATGAYLYALWYEAVDAQGELHRGGVSKVFVTLASGTAFSIAVPTLRLTRFASARLCVARSEVGATGVDATIELFRVTANDVTMTTGANCYVRNDPTVDTITFIDGLSDAVASTREPLYTNGGILSNDPSPWSGAVIAGGKSRLYWTDSTDPNVYRYSQQIADDTALEAPVSLSGRCDPLGGGIAAIGVMDDAFYLFKTSAIYSVSGPGPLADPSVSPDSNAFSSAELVTTDVGCASPASIGQTPLGITFQSAKGIKMLSRSRSIVDIGNPVEPLKGQTYTRTTLLPDRKAIVYLTDTPDGFSLLWDYNRDQWSKFSNHLGLDAIVVDGVYHYLRTDGRVFQETPGAYADDNSNIPLRIETSWLRFQPYMQGWQKILYAYFLGEYKSSHTLRIRYRLDFDAAYSPAIDLSIDDNYLPSLYGAGNYGTGSYGGTGRDGIRYQRSIHINRRCQAISFLIQDVEDAGAFGASFELAELLLIGGGLGPAFPVGAARSS